MTPPPTQAVSRKKVLLELLAEQEAQRCGLSPSDEEIDRLVKRYSGGDLFSKYHPRERNGGNP